MPFNATFDWVPRGLTFTPTTLDPDLHIHSGGPNDPDTTTIPSRYRIQTITPNPSYLTPALWIESMINILSQPSKSLILLESRNSPQEPGFAAPEDVIQSTIKALNLKEEQTERVIGKTGSLTDYFFSESPSSDSSIELAFRWTSISGCYVIFMGRFIPKVALGWERKEANRMVGIVSYRGLFPISAGKGEDEKKKEKKEKKNVIMDSDLGVALGKHAEQLGENPMSVFTVLLQLCESHLDEEIHELGVRIEGTPMEDFAQVVKEMAPEICMLRKACNDLLAICGGCLSAIKIWSQNVKMTGTQMCAEGLRRDVEGIKALIELRLEKLNYVDGVCSRMMMGGDSGRRTRFMEC
ncbi:hypothetical protein NEUTE1DRAFT_141106 [Neurospora tetrasperma FGSC 2508]|uniref:Uncharacterized protein n=1 Tax=Neurospora tetrasperma (strain FGSC 2508 / ATCC MYA-4615 / P0657) TaxID=510951 RepID=F8MVX9_NEUT8|nr:uncharacterized protein NEUTE1DRAFT_141106 [Neurospora tetrasperma FGSC 2508]EGO54827.1 hypothetical protein NEUTE1DRAFT_141106 [Neurospora tetrasperma FGSC 2508]EGZ67685.1 hypothetical protein NEUTE2DRAFT_141471 [Neurospora tetrasperma FGSC 2509]